METILIIAVVGALNAACFFIGAKVGQAAAKGEKLEVKIPDPVEAVRERRAQKEADREVERTKERIDTIVRNIDNYDGTANGQQDVPRG